ncbi:M48 family metalloprotease [Archangium sp.]|uniref:M48 family metalloprotease n=1 Tax=Archangium sp. TaxID=1872627 RepID=UPI002D37E710|nr:M48 family metalloprotease [Archangium sp.]HYO54006.1 M48 family metalloprotease [Archangium sp.]
MNRRQVKPLVACLMLSGLPGCAALQRLALDSGGELGNIAKGHAEAQRRADAIQKDCDALKARAISFEEESAFGGAVSVNWVSQGGGLTQRPKAHELHVQLNKIGKNLAAQSSRPDLPWTFGVLQSEGLNAVSGPGGYVFVSEGLLARLDNEAQLAGVLAHEIAHITGKHALHEYQAYLVDQCEDVVKAEQTKAWANTAQGLGRAAGGLSQALPAGDLRSLFTQLARHANFDFDTLSKEAIQAITNGVIARITEKGFRQDDEYAADTEAVELMAAAGYAPEEYVSFLSKLPDKGLSTEHPRKEKRQERLRKHLAKLREHASDTEFTTSVDLSQTKVVPLRDTLQD